jgi:hypothetical protein
MKTNTNNNRTRGLLNRPEQSNTNNVRIDCARRRPSVRQREFGFVPKTFNLFAEVTLDGDRIAREQAEADHARRLAEEAQAALFPAAKRHGTRSVIKYL